MKKTVKYILFGLCGLMTACTSGNDPQQSTLVEPIFSVSVEAFEGAESTRASENGLSLENGDQFRMQIICPFSTSHEPGETWGSYYNLNYNASSHTLSGVGTFEAQQTTYVYTAMNTNMTRVFVWNNYRYARQSSCFRADQRKIEDYKASDILWAQTVRQTGARNIHLNFRHKVARLTITLVDSLLSDNAIVSLMGMPDIDGCELVVGDYYADETYSSDDWSRFNYREKASCNYDNNGRVIGVEIINETDGRSCVWGLTGNPAPAGGARNDVVFGTIPNRATYVAHPVSGQPKTYYLLVPPCNLDPLSEGGHNAVFWVRDGEKRYSFTLETLHFEEGCNYPVVLEIKPAYEPDPEPEP